MSRNDPPSTARKLEFLSRRETYPGQTLPVEIIETHFAWVFLTERHAYKMKKPLRQNVMDYRSIASRERGCRNELRLNRRLAPTVYLEVMPLGRERDGSLVLGHGQSTVDWLVKMRRLPATRMLDRAIAQSTVSESDRNALIDLLAMFYLRARRKAIGAAEYVRQLRSYVEENFQSLCAADLGMNPVPVFQVIVEQRRFVDSNIELLSARASRLVECHGDLRPEHVYLGSRDDVACVIDCLEFDARLRRLDPLEELAFLALECRRLGAEALGQSVLQGVETTIGDVPPVSLVHFYMSHRALTRAKVSAWHLRDPDLPGSEKHWRDRADLYVQEALRCAQLATRAPFIEGSVALSDCSDTRPERLGRLSPEC